MKKRYLFLIILLLLGIPTTYANTNLLAGWDGNGDVNQTTSFPDKYGWGVNPGAFNYANAGSGLRWMDVTTGHKLDNSDYVGRLMTIRWDGTGSTNTSSLYSFPVTLEANKRYQFSWVYEWWNNASAPTLTVGINKSRSAVNNIAEADFVCASTKQQLQPGEFSFYSKEAGTYYLTIKGNGVAALCGIGKLVMEEVAPVLSSNVSSLSFTSLKKEVSIDIYPNGSDEPIAFLAPQGITITPQSLSAAGGTVTVACAEGAGELSDVIEVTQGEDKITLPVVADFRLTSVITEEGAWCWFADPRALHYNNNKTGDQAINSTYIGYIDVHGAVKATQISHINNTRSEILIRSYLQPDDHNNPTFLVLPDERIMIFYSRHTDEACFYYRVSQKPGDITTLGREVRLVTPNNTTYPSPFILSNDPEHIYLCWRGIQWHPTIGRMTIPDENDDASFNWGPKQIVRYSNDGTNVVNDSRPYAKYASNGVDKILLTYTTTHPGNESPNWVYFNYINIPASKNTADITLTDVKGKQLSKVDAGVHIINKSSSYATANPNAVVDNPTSHRDWIWEAAVAEDGNPVIAMVRITSDQSSHDYYQAKWTGSEWKKTLLGNGGGAFHQTPGREPCYSGGMAIDKGNTNIFYCSAPVSGISGKVFEIQKYTVGEDGKISTIQITSNSEKNNIRPYAIANTEGKSLLVWMYGDYYDWIVSNNTPLGFPTGIRAGFELPEETVDLAIELLKHEEFENADGFTGTATVNSGVLSVSASHKATIAVPASDKFSITLSPYISQDAYYGEILSFGNLTIGLNQDSRPKPYVKIGAETYTSSSTLGSSDVWVTQPRSTNGNWPTPTKFKFFSLTVVYENGVLRTYINGLMDQYIEVEGLSLSDITLGGFEGLINDCRMYNRVLQQDEIKAISSQLANEMAGKELELEFSALAMPTDIYTDIPLKTTLSTGNTLTWTSSDAAVLSNSGIVTLPAEVTSVTLTASLNADGIEPRVFTINVHPRSIENNQLVHYQFNESDVYMMGGERYVTDKSGRNNDAIVYGSATVNGVLDLSANTLSDFSTNGCAKVPGGVLKDLRSYTFLVKVNPVHLNGYPRMYDFGSGSGNSVFGRLSSFCAGVKYNGGTTVMLDSSSPIPTGKESAIAITFDAKTKTTKVYLNGVQTATATTITREPYELALISADTRNYLGRTQWWDTSYSSGNNDFCGTLDEFHLYDIALTKEEIQTIQLDPVGVNALQAISFSVYPNPVNAKQPVFISSDAELPAVVEIQDIAGRVVSQIKDVSFPVSIDSPELPGIYLISISDNEGKSETVKLIVK